MRGTRVKISDLILWQWRPSLNGRDFNVARYDWNDERQVRAIMAKWREHGSSCRCIPPIRIMSSDVENDELGSPDFLSKKAFKQYTAGKFMVWDGFHRIYAARRLGYKTIRAEVY
jgi:hypothetical protein